MDMPTNLEERMVKNLNLKNSENYLLLIHTDQ